MELPETWATKYILSIQFYGLYWHGNICLNCSLSLPLSLAPSLALFQFQYNSRGFTCMGPYVYVAKASKHLSLSPLSPLSTRSPLSPPYSLSL